MIEPNDLYTALQKQRILPSYIDQLSPDIFFFAWACDCPSSALPALTWRELIGYALKAEGYAFRTRGYGFKFRPYRRGRSTKEKPCVWVSFKVWRRKGYARKVL